MADYDNITLVKVRNWAKLKYSPFRISILLGLNKEDREVFLVDIKTDDHPLRKIYDQGVASGEYDMDLTLMKAVEGGDMDAEKAYRDRQKERVIEELKNELFGI